MAKYKVTYVEDDSYAKTGVVYVENVLDEYEAVDIAVYQNNLPDNIKILNVELICE